MPKRMLMSILSEQQKVVERGSALFLLKKQEAIVGITPFSIEIFEQISEPRA
ncbi:MAG: hypothetical protein ACTSUE_23530 [Promethearchaeota archaeon]